jgi:hypothetical protein
VRNPKLRGRTPKFDDEVNIRGSTIRRKKSAEFARFLLAKDIERWKLLFSKNKYQKPLDQ